MRRSVTADTLPGVDVDVAVPILLAVFAVLAAIIHRWWALTLPLLAIPLFYAGLVYGWWGNGVGDGWQLAAVMVTVVGLLGAAVGVALGRLVTVGRARRS
jgi:hypothetical protein